TPCWSPIVGIVGNVHQYGLDASPSFDVYFTGGWTPQFVVRTASDPSTLTHAVVDQIHGVDRNAPVTDITTLDELLSTSLSPRRFSMTLLGSFAVLALLLAAVGIYGVMSYLVTLRISEIGIRVALGAQPKDICQLIVGRGATLAVVGLAM